jgi:peptidoglycan hydrolase-like protein with peptidoglycan-binding domain
VRPLALVAGAVVVVALVILLVNAISSPAPSGSGAAAGGGGGGSGSSAAGGGLSVSTFPSPGAQDVPTDTVITVSFSQPVTLGKTTPVLSPDIGGKWVQSGPKTLSYRLQSPLIPDSQMSVTIPGGPSGIHSTQGQTLRRSTSFSFAVATGDTLRLQQLLAQEDYLPLYFTPSGPAPKVADLALDQAGTFNWRWTGLPNELVSLWTQGTSNEITRAAIEAFESANGLGVDGIAGPAVWTALINNARNGVVTSAPYVYVLVNKVEPENLTLWENGDAKYVGIPVNTGAPGADTTDGSFAVFEHVRYSDMKGTNIDGSTYNDPNVPYASYFNGGDALHGFIRASYGTPQSNGCVEMSYADAALVWPLTPIGTLVTVEGPDYGSAPPATTTTAPAAGASTATTAPAAAGTTTTAASPGTTGSTGSGTGNSGG